MSGTTTVESETGVKLIPQETELQPRRSKRLSGLEQSTPLDNLNIPLTGPPRLTADRGRETSQRTPQTGRPKGPVRFGREVSSLLMKPFGTRARSSSAGSGRSERRKGDQGGSLSDQEGFGGAKLKGTRGKSPTSSSEATPKRGRSPSPVTDNFTPGWKS